MSSKTDKSDSKKRIVEEKKHESEEINRRKAIGLPIRTILDSHHPLEKFLVQPRQEQQPYPDLLFRCDCSEEDVEDEPRCEALSNKWFRTKILGKGTYGSVALVRGRSIPGIRGITKTTWHSHETALFKRDSGRKRKRRADQIQLPPRQNDRPYPLFAETLILWYLRGAPRTSQLIEAYSHGSVETSVLKMLSADARDGESLVGYEKYWGYEYGIPLDGDTRDSNRTPEIFCKEKKSTVGEIETCKIIGQLLEAFIALEERQIIHRDVSHRNYIIDEEYNAELIDFGLSEIFLKGYTDYAVGWVRSIENMANPEEVLARVRMEAEWGDPMPFGDVQMDTRAVDMWRLGVLMYELLHGYSPWEGRGADSFLPLINTKNHPLSDREVALMKRRRCDIATQPLWVRDDLSQDCIDVLRALLAKDPQERPRPNELCTYAWFSGWHLDVGHKFQRKEKAPRHMLNEWSKTKGIYVMKADPSE